MKDFKKASNLGIHGVSRKVLALTAWMLLCLLPLHSQDFSTWMQDNWDIIGEKSLQQIVIPGSHDAGMALLPACTSFANPCNVQTQTLVIEDQLKNGFRYFDLRPNFYNPAIGDNDWFLGHFSQVEYLGGEGCSGEELVDVLQDVAGFLKDNPEIVILEFSHYYYTYSDDLYFPNEVDDFSSTLSLDHCPFSPCSFSYANGNDDYPGLLTIIEQNLGNYLFVNKNLSQGIAETPLETLLPAGSKNGLAIVIIDEPKMSLPSGIYSDSQIRIYNNYANNDTLSVMIADQKSKFLARAPLDSLKSRKNPNDMFLLSWTLTQQAQFTKVATCQVDPAVSNPYSILNLAALADGVLSDSLQSWFDAGIINQTTIPNVILTDNNQSGVAAVSIELNKQLYPK